MGMVEALQANGWKLGERITCCGPHRERWINLSNHNVTITIFPQKGIYTMRRRGEVVKTGDQTDLNEYIKTII